ncbi:GntR family transcriptional regulator [Tabrizicola sp.]|jgi:GntR family transcriptional regulator, rspAB operon transcriptional repressor|uniref:GntR family transcriptional regulator n=1 Tax=Tabrizicola sp. TaxID=2005166 RepID=UPI0025EBDF97|nr:GntR family transcriptional regulator [Tabrizicola sp.]MBY0350902.1 GntR family transcriptional regulator [Tabrizicola sp.]
MLQPPSTGSQDQNDAARLVPLDRLQGSLGQRVYQSLKHAILTLAYRPGDIIRKPEICDRLGVSRSPVADAVARLAADGLVDVVPQAGTFVTRLSMTDIREGAFIREAIEVAAAERVAEQVTDDQLRDLRRNLRLQEALAADGDQQGFMGLDGQMHDMMLSFTGFPRLPQVSQTAWLSVHRARQLILPVPGRLQATLDEHRLILAAFEARDPQAARLAVQHHLRQLLTYLQPLERNHPELFSTPGQP